MNRAFKLRGRIQEDDALHSPGFHAQSADHQIAPSYVEGWIYNLYGNKVQVPIPKYANTVIGESTKYDPAGNCKGNFMSYKFQPNNNCYNYGTNIATNSFAQPGRLSDEPINWDDITGVAVCKGAVSDGLVAIPIDIDTFDKLRTYYVAHQGEFLDGHFVALMISSPDARYGWTGDFHWARCDDFNTAQWSQKDGGDQVTNFDFAGKPIHDPAVANWTVNQGPLTPSQKDDVIVSYKFYCYMFVGNNRVNIL